MNGAEGSPRVLCAKIVYCGPAQSGKTATLASLHRLLDPAGEFRLYSVDSGDGQTLFFDLLPVREFALGPYRVRTRLFSTPGRLRYAPIRRCVLAHADAVVFIADARDGMLESNRRSLLDLEGELVAGGLDPGRIPFLLAANKRDQENSLAPDDLRTALLERDCPAFETVATRGVGVFDTFASALREALAAASARAPDEQARAALQPSPAQLQALLRPDEDAPAGGADPAGRPIVVSVPPPEGAPAAPDPDGPGDCPRCDELAAGAVLAQTRLAEFYDEIDASIRQLENRNRELLAITRVARSILSAMDIDNPLVVLLDVASRHLRASHVSCVVFDPNQKDGLRTHVQGFGKDPVLELTPERAGEFMDLLGASDAPLALTESDNVSVLKHLRAVDGRIQRAVFAGVRMNGQPSGWLGLYLVADETPLDGHALLFLSSLSGLASLGLEKIALLNEVKLFNTRLETEVQRRTIELEMANAKIRALNRGLESRVTERTRALATANDALKGAQAEVLHATRLRAMGGRAGDFAHQINNPVGSLASNLSFMRETLDDLRTRVAVAGSDAADAVRALDEFEQVLEESAQSTGRIERIIAGLKRFGAGEKAERKVSLNAAVADAITLLEDRVEACAELELRLGDVPDLERDALDLNHLVLALLTNAVEAMERKGERGRIQVTTYVTGDKVTLVVQDTGVGIDAQLQERLFEPFSSTKEGVSGAGLGLHAAYQTVQRRGGRIGVRSRAGEGATFTVVLPVEAKRPQPDELEAVS
ncbi:MAG: ATP-binding protein [Planctomycetota bacterium]